MTCPAWRPAKGDHVFFTGLYFVVPGPGHLIVTRAARDGTWVDLASPTGDSWKRAPTCLMRPAPLNPLEVVHYRKPPPTGGCA